MKIEGSDEVNEDKYTGVDEIGTAAGETKTLTVISSPVTTP